MKQYQKEVTLILPERKLNYYTELTESEKDRILPYLEVIRKHLFYSWLKSSFLVTNLITVIPLLIIYKIFNIYYDFFILLAISSFFTLLQCPIKKWYKKLPRRYATEYINALLTSSRLDDEIKQDIFNIVGRKPDR